jgi:hypothetical protein
MRNSSEPLLTSRRPRGSEKTRKHFFHLFVNKRWVARPSKLNEAGRTSASCSWSSPRAQASWRRCPSDPPLAAGGIQVPPRQRGVLAPDDPPEAPDSDRARRARRDQSGTSSPCDFRMLPNRMPRVRADRWHALPGDRFHPACAIGWPRWPGRAVPNLNAHWVLLHERARLKATSPVPRTRGQRNLYRDIARSLGNRTCRAPSVRRNGPTRLQGVGTPAGRCKMLGVGVVFRALGVTDETVFVSTAVGTRSPCLLPSES